MRENRPVLDKEPMSDQHRGDPHARRKQRLHPLVARVAVAKHGVHTHARGIIEKEKDQSMIQGIRDPHGKRAHIVQRESLQPLVQEREPINRPLVHVLLREAIHKRRERREEDVEKRQQPLVVEHLRRKAGEKPKQKLRQNVGDILVKRILDQPSRAQIAVASMDTHQPAQMLELHDRIVACARSLRALAALDAHADLRLLDHCNIIRAVANRKRSDLELLARQADHARLLQRRRAAHNHGLGLGAQRDKVQGEALEGKVERLAVNHERKHHIWIALIIDLVLAQCLAAVVRVVDIDHHNLKLGQNQLRGLANVDRGLLLVAREQPQLDSGLKQILERLRHIVLQAILDRSAAQELEINLEHFANVVHLLLAVGD
eukprot:comp19503_c0_seq1/m.37092 comp19503_c0_seq1/g.37092  ORF comp19503_c0_seq1/g.37092 comp19503_c0_seq1/m.37092 type:complete len:375 (+) comp19503_c0_seq1:464-1588(+)